MTLNKKYIYLLIILLSRVLVLMLNLLEQGSNAPLMHVVHQLCGHLSQNSSCQSIWSLDEEGEGEGEGKRTYKRQMYPLA